MPYQNIWNYSNHRDGLKTIHEPKDLTGFEPTAPTLEKEYACPTVLPHAMSSLLRTWECPATGPRLQAAMTAALSLMGWYRQHLWLLEQWQMKPRKKTKSWSRQACAGWETPKLLFTLLHRLEMQDPLTRRELNDMKSSKRKMKEKKKKKKK